ncbi:hypothetical protein BJ138DRAFT_1119017 [Hygrophoropsis aurantiaca]|uniref:Uncharacterized protein n=1 Tax=Hygrophoropsis aurantiaca TaxID=72124 RepID=A0ACB7ZVY0_9AGAM|nr:hypothetical protein BJ138DRAFT_1119017 [Hygrophoropsis aurantiaca]
MAISESATSVTLAANNTQSDFLSRSHIRDNISTVSGHGYLSEEFKSGMEMSLNLVLEDSDSEAQGENHDLHWKWSGPLVPRAIVPLPARALAALAGVQTGAKITRDLAYESGSASLDLNMQVETANDDCAYCDDEDSDGECEICTAGCTSRFTSFQSITATPGLNAWSFEELRMECYSQSRIATGAPPPSVPKGAPSWMIIPPAFVARSVRMV